MRALSGMENPVTFREYYGRFSRKLAKDATPWARDNIGFAGAMVFLPLVAVYWKDHIKVTLQLPPRDCDAMIIRLDRVRTSSHNLGYGVGDDMDFLLAKYTRK